jgi:ABC-type dipeptide/oligopeptide/nickel transport system permease subunit
VLSLIAAAICLVVGFVFGCFTGYLTCELQKAREEIDRERND